jgi:predicted membrane protein
MDGRVKPGQNAVRALSTVIVRPDWTIQYAAASRFILRRLWNTGSPAFAGDDG